MKPSREESAENLPAARSESDQTGLESAARRLRRALPCVRPCRQISLCADRSYTPPDAPVESLRRLHAHLGISRAVIVHASCHGTDMAVTLDAIASSNGAYRGVACVDDAVTDRRIAAPARGRHSRYSLQFRQTSGRRARSWRVLPAPRADQALGMAHRAALRCRRHLDPARTSGSDRRALHHRSHGPRQGGRRSRAATLPTAA